MNNRYIKKFENHSGYQEVKNRLDRPNVSLCVEENHVHYNPKDIRIIVTYDVETTSSPTKLLDSANNISEIEIDGVILQNIVTTYTFDTIGEHIVKYTLINPQNINNNMFFNCTMITSVILPNTITTIEIYAFTGCEKLLSINIPDSVTEIESFAFYDCWNLVYITLPNSITSIKLSTFENCGFTSFTIPANVENIGSLAFSRCRNLKEITSLATTAPTIYRDTFKLIPYNGKLYVPKDSTGYDDWMVTDNYYLGKYNWTKIEQ